jgi:hypothetical protein
MNSISVPTWFAALIVGALVSLQAWELKEISELREQIAALNAKVELLTNGKRLAGAPADLPSHL